MGITLKFTKTNLFFDGNGMCLRRYIYIFFNFDLPNTRLNSHYTGGELQEKEAQKDETIQEISLERIRS